MTRDEYVELMADELREFRLYMEANYPELNDFEEGEWDDQFVAFHELRDDGKIK